MAKLSTASIRLVQKLNRQMKDGTYPIYLVVCFGGRVEKKTGVSCLVRDWDGVRECVKRSCPNSPVLNKMLSDLKNRVIERKNDFEYNNKVYTPTMLLQNVEINHSGVKNVFYDLMKQVIEERRLKDGTIRSYQYTYRKLSEFLHKRDFIVDELTLGTVKDFAYWLERCNIKVNTIKRVLACTASIWNFAISKKIASGDDYPFSQFKYTTKYHDVHRDYFLEKHHIAMLKDYWMELCVEEHDGLYRFKDCIEDKLMNRCSAEFGILWFLMMFKMNGISPADFALIRTTDCKRVVINGEDYWSIDIRRKKTGRDVHIRMKRDIFVILGFEHFMMFSSHFVYPVIHWKENASDKFFLEQVHKVSDKAIKHVREAFKVLNERIILNNVTSGTNDSIVETDRIVMYSARHSFASQYLSSTGATVNGLASLMARSPNTIATYVHQLTRDEEIASMTDNMVI